MVSVISGLAVLAVLAVATLGVGATVVAGSMPVDTTGSHAPGDHACAVADAAHAALGHREPGQTVGSVISEIARQMCRPLIRH